MKYANSDFKQPVRGETLDFEINDEDTRKLANEIASVWFKLKRNKQEPDTEWAMASLIDYLIKKQRHNK